MYQSAGSMIPVAAVTGTTNVAVAGQDGLMNATGTPGWYALAAAHLVVAVFSLGALSLALWKLRPRRGAHRAWASSPVE